MGMSGRGKTALVTGASRGIGKGIALVLAANGYDLAITYRSSEQEPKEMVEQVAEIIERDYGRKCETFYADLAEEETANTIVDKAVDALGRIDVLVNNAGMTVTGRLAEMELDEIDYLINLNFRAPLLTMRAAARYMIDRKIEGNMINIASTRGSRAYPVDAVYGGTKAGLIRATQSVALECAPYGIRVNCIAPGAIKVRDGNEAFHHKLGKKIPLRRVGAPEDIGQAVLWLVSDHASYITGETLRVDGGLILPGMPEDVRPEAGYGWADIQD